MAPASARPHLQPLDSSKLGKDAAAALTSLEGDFEVDVHAVVKQMLWEFSQGLTKEQDASTRDSYLPMM
jgi:hypothetical protein